MRIFKFLASMVMVLLAAVAVQAQVTTSSMSGVVKSSAGELLQGASVKITHLPTGTVVTASTASNGRFVVSNLQPGGLYMVEVAYMGLAPQSMKEVYLDFG